MSPNIGRRFFILALALLNGLLMAVIMLLFLFFMQRASVQTAKADEGEHTHFRSIDWFHLHCCTPLLCAVILSHLYPDAIP